VTKEAIILVGGLGTRLRSVVKDIPKPLADVRGKPFLWYVIKKLLQEDVNRVILSSGYKAELIEEFVSEFFHKEDIKVVVEREPLGTGGALRFSMAFVSDYFFLLNGDSFFDIDLRKFEADSFYVGEFDISIALCEMKNPQRFGVVEIDKHFRVIKFREKGLESSIIPSVVQREMEIKGDKSYINAGIYIIKKYVLEHYLRNFPDKFSFEKDVLEKSDLQIIGIPYKGNFIDIGLPKDYIKASTMILRPKN
jgi:D-glycero-alpha-D-manno-heptose 1-phosphate guanylyltransferase